MPERRQGHGATNNEIRRLHALIVTMRYAALPMKEARKLNMIDWPKISTWILEYQGHQHEDFDYSQEKLRHQTLPTAANEFAPKQEWKDRS